MKAEYISHLGTDLTVVNAARVSFNKESLELDGKDRNLIQYLAKHEHWTPFAHCIVTLRETVPIFVARQRFKHTIGFVYNEVSRRYVDSDPEFYTPEAWRKKAANAKQGSSDALVDNQAHCNRELDLAYRICFDTYKELLKEDVAPEQARMVLPQSMYTSYYVTGSLAAWSRAFVLRQDSHAQKEIQDLARSWKEIIQPLFPVSWNALTLRNKNA